MMQDWTKLLQGEPVSDLAHHLRDGGDIMNGQDIVQIANDLYGPQNASTYWVYGSPCRPMSGAWARIPDARYVNANYSQDKVHTWVVVPARLERSIIDSYELTERPVYGPVTLTN